MAATAAIKPVSKSPLRVARLVLREFNVIFSDRFPQAHSYQFLDEDFQPNSWLNES
jgi:hypothetical protein